MKGRGRFLKGGIAAVIGRFNHSLREPRHPRTIFGLLRMWWSDFVIHPLFEGTEICEDCGRGYPLWATSTKTWQELMDGNAGLLCPTCFCDRMEKRGVIVQLLAVPWDRANPGRWHEWLDSTPGS